MNFSNVSGNFWGLLIDDFIIGIDHKKIRDLLTNLKINNLLPPTFMAELVKLIVLLTFDETFKYAKNPWKRLISHWMDLRFE